MLCELYKTEKKRLHEPPLALYFEFERFGNPLGKISFHKSRVSFVTSWIVGSFGKRNFVHGVCVVDVNLVFQPIYIQRSTSQCPSVPQICAVKCLAEVITRTADRDSSAIAIVNPVALVAYQVILEPAIGQFREFEPHRMHSSRINSWGAFSCAQIDL